MTDNPLGAMGMPSPPTQPAAPTSPLEALSGLMQGGDAETTLITGLLDHTLMMTEESIRAVVFLQSYGCGDIAQSILEMRRYQVSPKVLKDSLEAVSLKRFLARINVNLANS